jgi:hypothetical protein
MAFQVSTGLRDHMLDTGSFKTAMDDGFLNIYDGAVPASVEDSLASSNLLCQLTVSSGATRVTWEAVAINGIISKNSGEVWSGVNGNAGTATYFRFVQLADIGDVDPTALRVQGLVGLVGAELNLSSVALSIGATQTVNHFNVALPTL